MNTKELMISLKRNVVSFTKEEFWLPKYTEESSANDSLTMMSSCRTLGSLDSLPSRERSIIGLKWMRKHWKRNINVVYVAKRKAKVQLI